MTSTLASLGKFAGKRVFLSGHTGFKGSWMTALLSRLGAKIIGYALPPESDPSLFEQASISQLLTDQTLADIRDGDALTRALQAARPDLVIHMAAQALVRHSYAAPAATWDVNVMGTVNLLEAVRATPGISAAIIVTTDKCYDNQGWVWGYRETDSLGGHDPYSASKAAAELVVASYRRSFFAGGAPLIASARAGNVIGGGDWSEDRLLADAARSFAQGLPLEVRNPASTRPWQHVLDCLSGYLLLASALLEGDVSAATAFNFGPTQADNVSVSELLRRLERHWPDLAWSVTPQSGGTAKHEASYLYLDSSRAQRQLRWRPKWPLDTALQKTAEWYAAVCVDQSVAAAVIHKQLEEYLS